MSIIKWLIDRRVAKRLAATLIETMGPDAAWQYMFARARNLSLPEDERSSALRTLRQIERATGVKRQPDTATRYLQ